MSGRSALDPSLVSPPPGGPPPAEAPPPAPQHEAHLHDWLAVIFRHRGLAASVFLATMLAIMIDSYTKIPLYQAQARLLIENERAGIIPGLTSAPDAYYEEDVEPYYQTQYKILKGRDLARRVVRQLKLETNHELNGTPAPPSLPVQLLHRLRDAVNGAFGKDGLTGPAAKGAIEPSRPDEGPDESALVDAFLGRVAVEPVPRSRLVDVFYVSANPPFAAEAANALANEYVEQNLQVKLQSTQNMLEWLDKEVASQQQKVEASERQVAEYREKQNALSLDDKNNIVASRLNHLNDEVLKARTTRIQRQAVYDQVRSVAPASAPDAIPPIATNSQVQTIKAKLVDLQREKARLLERYEYKHPAISAVNSQLQDVQRQFDLEVAKALQAIKNEYETAVLEEQTLSRNLEAAKADATDLTRKSIDYNVMEREAKSNRQIYEALLQREKELRVSSNSRSNNVRVVDRAEVPKSPKGGDRRTWVFAAAMGLVLSLVVVFGLDYMNDTIKTPEDVTRRLSAPLLGLVPSARVKRSLSISMRTGTQHVRVRWRVSNEYPLITASHVPPDFAESFRTVRASLVAAYPRRGRNIVLVTSAEPLEGKTTTAANTAIALAGSGARVLLIDADMRRPGVHRLMRLANDRGLAQVLVGQIRLCDVIQRTVEPNLLAVTGGPTPPNPAELLASERMKALLESLGHMPYDWVILDTPPVLAVADALILASEVSGVTFVVRAESTRRRLAERALASLASAHSPQTAVVLNKVDFERNSYYYSRYYGRSYRKRYAEGAG
jgi:polysaccharide biosynthesis transport protein